MNRKMKFSGLLLAAALLWAAPAGAQPRPTGYTPGPVDWSHLATNPPRVALAASDLPASFDLRTLGVVPSVKDQGRTNWCWAISASDSCESSWLMQGHKPVELSASHLAWFSLMDPEASRRFTPAAVTGTDTEFHTRYPLSSEDVVNSGGNLFKAAAILSRLSAPVARSSMTSLPPADARPEDYFPVLMRLRSAQYLSMTDTAGVEIIKRRIMTEGACAIAYYASEAGTYYNGKTGARFYDGPDGVERANHEVLAVGWDDNYPRENFNEAHRPRRSGAWLLRNSWGKNWGLGGYFWLSYEDTSFCDGATFSVEPLKEDILHYGHDDLGFCSVYYHRETKHKNLAANVFRARRAAGMLREVAFYTTDNNADYTLTVYRLNDGATAPTSGDLMASVSGTMPVAGYHTIPLPHPVPLTKGTAFSVVTEMTTSLDAPIAVEKAVPNHSENAVVNPGESFFSEDGETWDDGFEVASADGDGKIEKVSINACIKAFTFEANPAAPADWLRQSAAGAGPWEGGDLRLTFPLSGDVTSASVEVTGFTEGPTVELTPGDGFTVLTVTGNASADAALTGVVTDGRELLTAPLALADMTAYNVPLRKASGKSGGCTATGGAGLFAALSLLLKRKGATR